MRATGGYETALLDALVAAIHPVHRADVRKVKAFIRSMGTLAKTDAIDARALARYGQERHDRLQRWVPADIQQAHLHALVMARRDIVADKTAWNNRQKAPGAKTAATMIAPILKALDTQLQAIDKAIARLVQTTHLATKARILQAIPGIGATTAYSLIALMPEWEPWAANKPPPSQASHHTPNKADKATPTDASGAADHASDKPSSWPP